jgi:hypothetical protein
MEAPLLLDLEGMERFCQDIQVEERREVQLRARLYQNDVQNAAAAAGCHGGLVAAGE